VWLFARSDFVLEYIQILEFRICQPSQIKLVKVVQLFGLTPHWVHFSLGVGCKPVSKRNQNAY
jgi:hypothetical protein